MGPLTHLYESIADTVNNSNIAVSSHARRSTYKSPPYTPPQSSSLFWWMVGNYTLLVILIGLVLVPVVMLLG